jgi:hypothetical protein
MTTTRSSPLSLHLQQAECYGRAEEDWGHAAYAGAPEAPKVRSGAGNQGPDAEKPKAIAATHKKNQASLAVAGYKNTFAGFVPACTSITRPPTDEEKSRSSLGSATSIRRA